MLMSDAGGPLLPLLVIHSDITSGRSACYTGISVDDQFPGAEFASSCLLLLYVMLCHATRALADLLTDIHSGFRSHTGGNILRVFQLQYNSTSPFSPWSGLLTGVAVTLSAADLATGHQRPKYLVVTDDQGLSVVTANDVFCDSRCDWPETGDCASPQPDLSS